MAELQSTNVQGSLCVNGVAIGGGKDFKYCCFTSSTTFTPSQDLVDGDGAVNATLVGGGGGGGFVSTAICAAPNFNSSYSFCAYGGPGGGAGMGQYLQKISATDACTVTVGAGGVGEKTADMMETPQEHLTASAATGGTSTFGDYSEFGGGSGCSSRVSCCVFNNFCRHCGDPTRNGAGSGEWGGGAQPTDTIGGGYKTIGTENQQGNNCVGINLPWQDRLTNWGTANTTSSAYHFYPKHQCLQTAHRVCCATSNNGYDSQTFYGSRSVNQPWMQNNGVRLDNGRVIGTNKLSIFETGTCCESSTPYLINNNAGIICAVTSSDSNAINCGGGGGKMCMCTCFQGVRSGVYEAQQQGAKGGDGLVILKWFE